MSIIGELFHIPADEWVAKAVCPQTDAEEFFPEKGENATRAKAVCRTCPVRIDCLDWALTHNEVFGVWGGFTARERSRIQAGHNPLRPYRTGTATRPSGHGIACKCVVCRRPA